MAQRRPGAPLGARMLPGSPSRPARQARPAPGPALEGSEPVVLPPGFEEAASEELEPEEEAVAESASEEDSEALDVVSSEELDLFSDDEPSEGASLGGGEPPSEDLEFISSEDEASPGDPEELLEECEELLSEDSGPEPEALPLPRGRPAERSL